MGLPFWYDACCISTSAYMGAIGLTCIYLDLDSLKNVGLTLLLSCVFSIWHRSLRMCSNTSMTVWALDVLAAFVMGTILFQSLYSLSLYTQSFYAMAAIGSILSFLVQMRYNMCHMACALHIGAHLGMCVFVSLLTRRFVCPSV
jgi:hypothetical protein